MLSNMGNLYGEAGGWLVSFVTNLVHEALHFEAQRYTL